MKVQFSAVMILLCAFLSGCGGPSTTHETPISAEPVQTSSSIATLEPVDPGEASLAIKAIEQFATNPPLSKKYQSIKRAGRSPSQKDELLRAYDADGDTYLITDANTISEFLSKNTETSDVRSIVGKRYTQTELEEIAKKIIPTNLKIESLYPNHINKLETNYFFRWEDRNQKKLYGQYYPYVDVAINNSGQIFHYINILE
jgi:hypothetical protein